MKKKLTRLLAMTICLCMLAASAMAADLFMMPAYEGDSIRTIENVLTVEDSLIIVTRERTNLQLWRWTEEMPQAELYADGLTNLRFLSQSENVSGKQGGFDWIFTDGEKLYGFNSRESNVYTIAVQDGKAACTRLCELGNTAPMLREIDYLESFAYPGNAFVVGNKLVWHCTDMRTDRYADQVLIYDLATGYVKQAVTERVLAVTPHRDNRILMVCSAKENGSAVVYSYDVVTDAANYLGDMRRIDKGATVVYHLGLDLLLYQDDSCIMGWSAESCATKQVAFVPTLASGSLALLGDTIIHASAGEIVGRTVSENYAEGHCLRILDGTMNDVTGNFARKYIEVPYYYMTTVDEGEPRRAIMSRDVNSPDLAYFNLQDGEYLAMRDEGYFLDLSDYPALMAYADSLYPVFREVAMKDGALYGIPVYAASYNGWFINKQVMKDMGLTVEEIPTSLTELCAFATRWSNEYVDKYPQYTLLNTTEDYRERFFEAMLEEWLGYCQAKGMELTFDDPVFLEMLSALDGMDVKALDENLKQADPEKSEYKQALIWTGCKLVANWATYMEEYSDRVFIPLTLTPDTEFTLGVSDIRLWTVNAKTEDAEFAVAMLTEKVQNHISDKQAHVLQKDRTEPVINKYYEESLAYEEERLQRIRDSLVESVNKEAVEKRIAEQERYIETELKRQMYDVTPSAVENYIHVLMPAMYIRQPDAFWMARKEASVSNWINRYIGGTIPASQLVEKLNEWFATKK